MGIDGKWSPSAFLTNLADGGELEWLLWVSLLSLAWSLFPLPHTTGWWFSGSNKMSKFSELPLAFLGSQMTLVRWDVGIDSQVLVKKQKANRAPQTSSRRAFCSYWKYYRQELASLRSL